MRRFDKITVRANATVGVGAVGVGVVHTVIGARLVVVSVHVGHGGRWVTGCWEGKINTHARLASVMELRGWMVVLVMRVDDEADVV